MFFFPLQVHRLKRGMVWVCVCPKMLVFSETEVNPQRPFHNGFLTQLDFLAAFGFHLPYRQSCLVVVALSTRPELS